MMEVRRMGVAALITIIHRKLYHATLWDHQNKTVFNLAFEYHLIDRLYLQLFCSLFLQLGEDGCSDVNNDSDFFFQPTQPQ